MTSHIGTAAGLSTAAAGQTLQATPLSSISGVLQSGVSNLSNTATNTLNRFFPPERRANLQAKLTKFAAEKPYLASFLLSQIALSGLPILLFATFTVGVGIFALLVALLVAVLGAVLFTVFMAGVALLVLLPTLFITTFSAAFIWLWGVGLYYFIKWFNEKPVPGIHTSLKDGLMQSTGLNAIHGSFNDAITDQKMPGPEEQDPSGRKEYQSSKESQEQPQRQPSQQGQRPETQTQQPKSNSTSENKPKPLSEKRDGANATPKPQGSESPATTVTTSKSPARNIKSAGSDVTKKASSVTGGSGGITSSNAIAVGHGVLA